MRAALAQRMTYAEYCAFERAFDPSRGKHEFLRGEVFAMTGGSLEHARLGSRINYLLNRELVGRPCRVYSSDARVRIEATDLDTYPDVSVVCGAAQTVDDGFALTNPVLLIEVLSDSTEGYERGQKAAHYRRIPSLQAYLLVAQHEARLELMVRRNDSWSLIEAGPGESLAIEALAITLDVDEVYAQLGHAPPSAARSDA